MKKNKLYSRKEQNKQVKDIDNFCSWTQRFSIEEMMYHADLRESLREQYMKMIEDSMKELSCYEEE